MKKNVFIILLLLFTYTLGFSQVVSPVKDKAKLSVLNNIEFKDRVKLQPEWYHYSIWYMKVLGVKIPMVGLGLHNSYAKKDMRNILQEVPLMATVAYTKEEASKQHEETDKVYNQELFKFADKEVDYQYTLTKSKRNELISDITEEISKYAEEGGTTENVKTITDEVIRIRSNIDVIHQSHMSNAKKRESYLSLEQELIELRSLTIRLNNINKVARYE